MSEKILLKTDMHCEACIRKVKPALENVGISSGLKFDLASPDKTVEFFGTPVDRDRAIATIEGAGYVATPLAAKSDKPQPAEPTRSIETYKPLITVAAFLVGVVVLVEMRAGGFDWMRAMNNFMGGFFILFSFFKLLDLKSFVDAYSTYDVIARKFRVYGAAYPFIELGLGVCFILQLFPTFTNSLTILLMVIGNVGVWGVLRKKQVIQCACLGTIFKLPMTKVTLFENTLMLVMAALSLAIA